MPIITETITSSASSNSPESVARNFADAVAKVVGTETKTTSEGRNYVSMDAIGYPGWCFTNYVEGKDIQLRLCKTNADGTPNYDGLTVGMGHLNKPVSEGSYKYATCVMLYDENKDTVLFNIHRGETQHGTDIKVDGTSIDFMFFLAKDINNEVLGGAGRLFPVNIMTSERTGKWAQGVLQKPSTVDALHITKMVNYLSPGYPEMKSAYVSVTRPLADSSSSNKYVGLYNVNGVNYGRASFVNSWDPDNIADGKCYYPFDPFVKY